MYVIRAQTTARQSRGTLLLYSFHVLATRTIEDVNLRHSLKIKMADEMHDAMTTGHGRLADWFGAALIRGILARHIGRALR
jgi:hypothetical protein